MKGLEHHDSARRTLKARGGLMSDTKLQLAKTQVSKQKQLIMRQQGIILGLKREGGRRLEEAVEV